MINIIYGILGLSLLILVHEFGHYLAARLVNVKVLTFSLGFGKKLLKFRKGETEYALSAVPLGGYVKMLGESSDEEVDEEDIPRSFSHKSPGVRIFIAFAGPFFNLLLAVVLFFLVLVSGYNVLSAKVGTVEKGYPAYEAGIREGDVIVAIEGKKIGEFQDLMQALADAPAGALKFTVLRGGRLLDLVITPKEVEAKNIFGDLIKTKRIGVSPAGDVLSKRESAWGAASRAVSQTYNLSTMTVMAFGKLIQGSISRKEIGGPLTKLQMAPKQAEQGKSSFIYFIGFISISLAILNLCPIPVLDGGYILLSLIEFVIRRKLPDNVMNGAQYVGLAIIVTLMFFALGNDLDRTWHIYDKFGKIIGGK
jgi:regulator of sigma E protease